MIFHLQIIFIGIAAIALFLIYMFRWRDYRLPRKYQYNNKIPVSKQPKLSVIIPSFDQARYLEQNLPFILDQQYPNFEVIVVNIASTDDTSNVLECLEAQHKNLRHTFVPQSSRYIDRHKLAVTLGIRTARSEWCVLTAPDCKPASNLWLATMAQHLTPITIGYANYIDDDSRTAHRAIYERLNLQLRILRSSLRGKACGADGVNLIISKELFLSNNGFSKHLELPFGSETLLINQLATPERVSIVWSPNATMYQELSSPEVLENERMYIAAIRTHLNKRAHWFFLREGMASSANFLFLFTLAGYVISRVYESLHTATYDLIHLSTDIPATLFSLIWLFVPVILFRQLTRLLGLRRYVLTFHLYSLMQPFRTVANRVRCMKHKDEFMRPIV